VPLAFVLGIGMLKELIADIKRWNEDKKTNEIKYQKVQTKEAFISNYADSKSSELKVGDIILLADD
jgi:hypothetical protein